MGGGWDGSSGGNCGGKGAGGGWGGKGACQQGGKGVSRPAMKGGNQQPQDMGATCIVSNIPDEVPLDEFKENLTQAGNVKSAKFIGAGKALVSFATAAEANQCVGMFNGCDVGSAKLQVRLGKQ